MCLCAPNWTVIYVYTNIYHIKTRFIKFKGSRKGCLYIYIYYFATRSQKLHQGLSMKSTRQTQKHTPLQIPGYFYLGCRHHKNCRAPNFTLDVLKFLQGFQISGAGDLRCRAADAWMLIYPTDPDSKRLHEVEPMQKEKGVCRPSLEPTAWCFANTLRLASYPLFIETPPKQSGMAATDGSSNPGKLSLNLSE